MPTVIAIVNEKGGTGKTTTAVNLSAALGEQGKKVLLVDLDGQAASSRWLGVEEDNRLAEAMCRGRGLEPIWNVWPNVSLAPASGKLDSVAHDLRPTQGGQLRKVLAEMTGFDFIFIDCPPSLGNRLIGNALLAASHVIVPVETSILALDGLRILLTTLDDVREGFGHDIILAGVLACRYDPRTRLSRLVLAELQRALPEKVFDAVIRENVRIRECPASGQSILSFAPDSHAAEDYRALAREMLQQEDKWRLAVPAGAVAMSAADQRLAVKDLRANASARVREMAQAGWQEPADQGVQAGAPEVQTDACPMEPPSEERAAEGAETEPSVPAQAAGVPPADAAGAGPSDWPQQSDADQAQREAMPAWLAELDKAKSRLEAQENGLETEGKAVEPEAQTEEATIRLERPPRNEANVASSTQPSAAASDATAACPDRPGDSAAAVPDQPTPSQDQTSEPPSVPAATATSSPQEQQRTDSEEYPALRALLEQMLREGKLPSAQCQPKTVQDEKGSPTGRLRSRA